MSSTRFRSSHPEWFEELLKLREERFVDVTNPDASTPEWSHFVSIYRRILRASTPNWAQRWRGDTRAFDNFVKNSPNSRILYASQGKPIAMKQLEEVWNLYIVEKLIS